MRLEICHTTEYRYSEDAWDSHNEVNLYPTANERQHVRGFHLDVQPHATITTHPDYFGSLVHHVHVHERHRHLLIQAQSMVDTFPIVPPPPTPFEALDELRQDVIEFLVPSPRVPHGLWPTLFGVTPPEANTDLAAFLKELTAKLNQEFTYKPGATNVRTTLEQFAQSRAGVCQDFTHAMLGICRVVGIPARYVSGYLYSGGEMLGADATHAWLEALIPGQGWVGYDPTNNCLAGEKHVKIGHGRDYGDVSPVRGTFYGGGRQALEVSVHVYN